MDQLSHDTMAIIRLNGQPDVFLTMIYYPLWSEIQDIVFLVQTIQMNPGNQISAIIIIERQSRGGDHVHQIIFLNDDKMAEYYPN
jgi:hypothetical protein